MLIDIENESRSTQHDARSQAQQTQCAIKNPLHFYVDFHSVDIHIFPSKISSSLSMLKLNKIISSSFTGLDLNTSRDRIAAKTNLLKFLFPRRHLHKKSFAERTSLSVLRHINGECQFSLCGKAKKSFSIFRKIISQPPALEMMA